MALGVDAEVDVHLGEVMVRDDLPFTVLSTGYSLPTGCVSFDAGAKTYGAPTTATTPSSTASATVAPTNKANGAGGKGTSGTSLGVSNPFGNRDTGVGRMKAVVGLLVIVSACFMMF